MRCIAISRMRKRSFFRLSRVFLRRSSILSFSSRAGMMPTSGFSLRYLDVVSDVVEEATLAALKKSSHARSQSRFCCMLFLRRL